MFSISNYIPSNDRFWELTGSRAPGRNQDVELEDLMRSLELRVQVTVTSDELEKITANNQ
jgi:hypothetical protein